MSGEPSKDAEREGTVTDDGFGRRVRLLREQRGWSQGDLAKASGVGQSQISKIEAGDQDARVGTARRLAQALGVSIDVLAGYEPVPVDLSRAQELARLVLGVRPHDRSRTKIDSNTDSRNLKAARRRISGLRAAVA